MKRSVRPEWLDELLADDPLAIGSRRDLRWLNRIMGHAGTLRDLLAAGVTGQAPKRIVELGAGDGTLMLRLAGNFSRRWPRVEVVLVDRNDAVTDETRAKFAALDWKVEVVAADVFDWLKKPSMEPVDMMIANLFLHHFSETQLATLLKLAAARTKLFAACEPRRAALPLILSRMLRFIGCNAVTRHDAPLSVLAGFAENEISELWPEAREWHLRERGTHLFTHAFLARRTKAG